MQQEEFEYGEIDRKKVALVVIGIVIALLAVFLAVYLFTDRTDAAIGGSNVAVIAPERIEQISEEVSGQVLEKLRTEILAQLVSQSIEEELSADRVYEVLKDKEVEFGQLSRREIKNIVLKILSKQGIGVHTGDGDTTSVFTKKQETQIREVVEKTLKDSLAHRDVNQVLSETEKTQLLEQLKQELSSFLQTQIQNSCAGMTQQDFETMKTALQQTKLAGSAVPFASQQQIDKLQETMLKRVQETIRTPVKGKDYLTDAEVKAIQEKVLKKAKNVLSKNVDALTGKVKNVKDSVKKLSEQVKKLKALAKERDVEITKIQTCIQEIQDSITGIYTITTDLSSAITITGNDLEKVSGSGSEIQSAKVLTENMTIAQFVDVLAGNDKLYTSAIQELDQLVKQLIEKNITQDASFEKAVKELEQSIDENEGVLAQVKDQLEQKEQQLMQQIKQLSEEQGENLKEQASAQEKQAEEEQEARKDADEKLQSQIDDTNQVIGEKESAGKIEGDTIFEKIGTIVKILSSDGLEGLRNALNGVDGAQTLDEGINNIHTDLTDTKARVTELEKEKWFSNLTLLANDGLESETTKGYACQESGSGYAYQIPLVSEQDQILLDKEDTAIVVEFKQPQRLPSNALFATNGNNLVISFTNKPTRNIEIVSIHVYQE